MQHQSVLHFWFEELTAKRQCIKDAALDATIMETPHRNAILGRTSVNVQPPPPLRRFLDPLTLAVFNNEEPRDETHPPRPPAH